MRPRWLKWLDACSSVSTWSGSCHNGCAPCHSHVTRALTMVQLSLQDLMALSHASSRIRQRCTPLLWSSVTLKTYQKDLWVNLTPSATRAAHRLREIIAKQAEVARTITRLVVVDDEPQTTMQRLHHLPPLSDTHILVRSEYLRHMTDVVNSIVQCAGNLRSFQ